MELKDFSQGPRSAVNVGLGCWGLGGVDEGNTSYGELNDTHAASVIVEGLAAGSKFVDTAPAYGAGQSERVVCQAIQKFEAIDDIFIASKIGMIEGFEPIWQKGEPAFWSSLEGSLQRLDISSIDLIQLHSPPTSVFEEVGFLSQILERWKNSGIVKSVGLSAKTPLDALLLLEKFPFEAIQVNLNMMDVRAVDVGLLKKCAEMGISVIARTPLNFGFLTLEVDEYSTFPNGDHRNRWSFEQRQKWSARAKSIQAIAHKYDGQVVAGGAEQCVMRALRFCLSFPEVAIVLPGPMSVGQAQQNALAGVFGPLPDACIKAIVAESSENRSK